MGTSEKKAEKVKCKCLRPTHANPWRPNRTTSPPLASKRQKGRREMLAPQDITHSLIRPFYITILYHNSLLFIDIFHIKRWYLCYFIYFCMIDEFWRMNHRSQDSDGKSTVWRQNWRRSQNTRKYMEIPIFP